jgi:hypothetical protein
MTLDTSPISINANVSNNRSLNPNTSSLSKKSLIVNGPPPKNGQSPNFKRIVNIYSVNSYKKKKQLN